uniref:Annexin n=1 Tax=Oncorhynchus tshawytscha TaxID=74940 RepID=A0AAZ3SNA2_ONCTS
MAAIGNRGTVVEAAAFNVEEDVNRLRGAMKGAGTDEAVVIEVLARRTIAQRQRIKEAYKLTVGKDLAGDLQGELTGNTEKVVLGLLMIAPKYDAYELRTAIKGSGTEEAALIDILASRTNAEIRAITEVYMKEHGTSLEDDIEADTSGMFKRVLVSLLTAGRDESNTVNETQAVQDAKDIYEAGEACWGTDEVKFLTVLCVRNRNHLLRGNCPHIIAEFVRSCFGMKCLRNKPAFFAERLYKSMKGLGTTDSILIRIMVARAEIDMLDIKTEFSKAYGKTLHSFINGDSSGDYRKILLELCGE